MLLILIIDFQKSSTLRDYVMGGGREFIVAVRITAVTLARRNGFNVSFKELVMYFLYIN